MLKHLPARTRAPQMSTGHLLSLCNCAVRVSLIIKKTALWTVFFIGAEGEARPSMLKHLPARTRKTKQSTGLFLFAAQIFLFESLQLKKDSPLDCLFYGAEGETRTLAPVARPTPLAGAPRHQLEYFCKLTGFTCQVFCT